MTECCYELMRVVFYDWMLLLSWVGEGRPLWLSAVVTRWVPSLWLNVVECWCFRELMRVVLYDWMLLWAGEGRPLWLNVVVSWWGPPFMTECCCELMSAAFYGWILCANVFVSWCMRTALMTECCCELIRARECRLIWLNVELVDEYLHMWLSVAVGWRKVPTYMSGCCCSQPSAIIYICMIYECVLMWPDDHDDVIKWKPFRVTGPLCGEFTGPRWIPRTKASDAELWCFLWCAPWINGWVNNREAADSSRLRDHSDVIVMIVFDMTECCELRCVARYG